MDRIIEQAEKLSGMGEEVSDILNMTWVKEGSSHEHGIDQNNEGPR